MLHAGKRELFEKIKGMGEKSPITLKEYGRFEPRIFSGGLRLEKIYKLTVPPGCKKKVIRLYEAQQNAPQTCHSLPPEH